MLRILGKAKLIGLVCLFSASVLPAAGFVEAAELRRGVDSLPATANIDPHQHVLRRHANLGADLYTGLYAAKADGSVILAAAEDDRLSADGLTVTFTLRSDLRWTDGEPVTAEDFVFAFRRLANPEIPAAFPGMIDFLQNAKEIRSGSAKAETLGVRALNARTLELKLAQPTPYLADLLANPTFAPLPRHQAADGGLSFQPGRIVTNGAFILVSVDAEDGLELRKNPDFYDAESVALDRVVYRVNPKGEALLDAVESGALHMTGEFPLRFSRAIAERLPGYQRVYDGMVIDYLAFNTVKSPCDDRRVRRALALLINRTLLTRAQAGLRLATPTRRLVAPLIANSAPPALPDEPEDIGDRIAEANALLEEAGYGPDNPLPLRLRSLNNDNATRTSFSRSELIETLWRQRRSFIEIETLTASSDEHYAALSEGDYDVALAGWAPDFNDPLAYLYRYRFRNNGSNFINFEDAQYQDLLRRAEQETDPAARAELLADAESLLLESYALVPIARRNVFSLVSPRLRGWEPNPIGFHPSRWMSLEAKMQ